MNRTAFVLAVLLGLLLLAWLLAAASRQERRPFDRPLLARVVNDPATDAAKGRS